LGDLKKKENKVWKYRSLKARGGNKKTLRGSGEGKWGAYIKTGGFFLINSWGTPRSAGGKRATSERLRKTGGGARKAKKVTIDNLGRKVSPPRSKAKHGPKEERVGSQSVEGAREKAQKKSVLLNVKRKREGGVTEIHWVS